VNTPYDCSHLDHLKNVLLWRSPGPGDNTGWIWEPGTEGVEIVLRGRTWIDHAGIRCELRPGAMVWSQPGERTLSRVDPAAPYHTLLIRFATTRPTATPAPRVVWWTEPAEAEALASEVVPLFARGTCDNRWFASHLYSRLWWQVHRASVEGSYGWLPVALQAALSCIDRRFAEPLTVAMLANAAGLKPTALYQRFQRFLGLTPIEALIQRRIRAANALLIQEPHLPVAQVGVRCGFRDPVNFGRMFRARQGVTPGAFRSRHAAGQRPAQSTVFNRPLA
jgi:AraC-like DNA-binding protein